MNFLLDLGFVSSFTCLDSLVPHHLAAQPKLYFVMGLLYHRFCNVHNFDGLNWTANGPALITRVVGNYCHRNVWNKQKITICNDVQILPSSAFFAVPYTNWKSFFDSREVKYVERKIQYSFGVHFWNKLSKVAQIIVGSTQPLSLLAKENCPRAYWTSPNENF